MKKIKIKPEAKRISGKEFNSIEFFNLNRGKIINTSIAVIAVIFLVTAVFIWHGNKKTSATFLMTQARDLFYSGKYETSLEVYNRFVKDFPKNSLTPAAYLGAGYCYEQLKNFEEAKKNYAEIQKKFASSPWADEAVKGIERLS